MAQQRILIILLNFRTPEMTLQSAEAALQELEDLPGELLIIDNGSGDGSYEHIRAAAETRGWLDSNRVRVIASPVNGGFGAGMNIGLSTGLADGSAPEFYYLLNSDAFVQGSTIRTLRNFLLQHPGAGLAGSYVRGTDGTPHRTAFRFPSIAGEFEASVRTGIFTRLLKPWVVAMEMPQAEVQVDWTAGASLMIRREAVEAVGGFDETFFLYFEETDLCRRAARAGWRTHYVPASEVAHIGSASTGMKGWQRTPGYWFDSRLHYFVKNHGRAYAAAATLARISGSVIYSLRRLIQNKPQADPPYFLRDLCLHSLRALFAPRRTTLTETRLPSPLAKEQK
ncbi:MULTISPECIES: glycosyltransferase family 2 protein [unclassified Leisingera]|uniref:glycosyltransferase family 2 protein n=1 Tax=unclassified Leisingera TaxID=2614906 RepID=UPI0002F393D1|nr:MULTISPECIES: glycosyltransferase family 2 protein [unclassified Leisingera]KIC23328.1 glycosyl transferase [Leisingera sp. ANG-S3]KIC54831.1 glycosyl transferase [Leisingera sp. ANG-S]KID08528.1 glycosyl transferase [Leisingera sp. ANG1]